MLYDVRDNLGIYHDRMGKMGRQDDARLQIERLGHEFPGWRGLEALIDELLGRDTAIPAPSKAEAAHGSAGGLVFIDTGPLAIERASDPEVEAAPDEEGAPSVTADLELEERPEAVPLDGLESTSSELADDQNDSEVSAIDGLVSVEQTSSEVAMPTPLDGLERSSAFDESDPDVPDTEVEGLESTGQSDAQTGADEPTAGGVEGEPEGIVFLDTHAVPAEESPSVPREFPIDDPVGNRVTAHALLESGDRTGGIAALDAALAGHTLQEDWLPAYQVASELTQADPSSIHRHQARVEVASRMRDVPRLCEAYADLADTFARAGSADKSVAVYRRILELDEHHERARAALRAMAPPPENETPDGFIDFGAMVIDDAGPRSTRMRTEAPSVAPDEDDTFREALAEFKRALDQNLPAEDYQAHYDLGIAFKEMGLLDEAIGEFQKALRAPEGRLRTSEALGQVFFEQNRPAVAEAVLKSVEKGPEGDADKIGVLYWLGRSQEAQGKDAQARGCYERVLAVDVAFADASDRLTHLDDEGAA